MSDPDDSLLMAFADGELDPVAARRVEAALERDLELQRKVERLRRSAHLVRAAFSHSPCQSAPSRRNVAMGRTAPRPRYALLAACVALFMAGAVTGSAVTLFRPSVSFADRLLDEVADYHALYARETEHQAEVPAARLEHIEEWLGERLHRRLVVPKLSEHGLTFAGARLLVVDGTPVAQLLYHRPGHEHEPLGLCISLDTDRDPRLLNDERDGLREVLWHREGYAYVLVGWESRKFLTGLAAELAPAFAHPS